MIKTKIIDVSDLNKENIIASEEFADEQAYKKIKTATASVEIAAAILAKGGTVAFPTETVYGLGANALDPKAVARIFEAKGRPSDNPIIVHIAKASDIIVLSKKLTPKIVKLIDEFWPGPLTLVLPKVDGVPDIVTAGLPTVGIRMPDDPIALELIRRAGCPVAAPSANISGKPSPTKAQHVVDDLSGRVDMILMGSDCRIGIESTVLDMSGDVPMILRPGIITREDILEVIGGRVEIDPGVVSQLETPKAPGMKYTHYAPNAPMTVFEGLQDNVALEIQRIKTLNEANGLKVGVILFEPNDYITAANEFFNKLRELDKDGVDMILAGAVSRNNSLGFAVMNRMMKSAGYNIVKV